MVKSYCYSDGNRNAGVRRSRAEWLKVYGRDSGSTGISNFRQQQKLGIIGFEKGILLMKVRELIDYLQLFNDDEELEIYIYETISNNFIDTTADIVIEDSAFPSLRIDVEAGKFTTN